MAKRRKLNIRNLMILILACILILILIVLLAIRLFGGKGKEEPAPETSQPVVTETPVPQESAEAEVTVDPSVFTDPDSYLILANKKHRLPEGYEPSDLATPEVEMRYNTWTLRLEAAEALERMFAAAEEEGIHLVMGSGYRGESFQTTLYNGYCEQYGCDVADQISSRPGYSDHQTGLATDLCGTDENYDLSEAFETTAEGTWLKDHAHEYGFIMRYPKGKEEITGYSYEPWHFRYVGVEYATKIYEKGEWYSFEEYFNVEGGDYE